MKLKLDTAIVDEAGCVLEPSIPVLLTWRPENLILIGDHLQLPAYTGLPPNELESREFKYHNRYPTMILPTVTSLARVSLSLLSPSFVYILCVYGRYF